MTLAVAAAGRGGRAGVAARALGAPRVAAGRAERVVWRRPTGTGLPRWRGRVRGVAGVAPSAAGGGRLGRPARPGGGGPPGAPGRTGAGARARAAADGGPGDGRPSGPDAAAGAPPRGPQRRRACRSARSGRRPRRPGSRESCGCWPRPGRSPRTSAPRWPRPCCTTAGLLRARLRAERRIAGAVAGARATMNVLTALPLGGPFLASRSGWARRALRRVGPAHRWVPRRGRGPRPRRPLLGGPHGRAR